MEAASALKSFSWRLFRWTREGLSLCEQRINVDVFYRKDYRLGN
jgi:hypothetical protein